MCVCLNVVAPPWAEPPEGCSYSNMPNWYLESKVSLKLLDYSCGMVAGLKGKLNHISEIPAGRCGMGKREGVALGPHSDWGLCTLLIKLPNMDLCCVLCSWALFPCPLAFVYRIWWHPQACCMNKTNLYLNQDFLLASNTHESCNYMCSTDVGEPLMVIYWEREESSM